MNKFRWISTVIWAIVNGVFNYFLCDGIEYAIFAFISTLIMMPIISHIVDWVTDVNDMLKEHKESESEQ